MQTIQFERDKSQFMSTLRKNVNEYFKSKGISTKGNWKTVLKTAAMLAIYLTPFILMFTVNMFGWMIFPLAVIMGIGMAGTGMAVMHDGLHGSSSKKNWLNNLSGSTIYMLGSTSINWKVQHNMLHHTFTNIHEMDEDIESKSALRLSVHAPLKKIHRYQYIYAFFLYSLMIVRKLVNDFAQFARYRRQGFIQQQNAKPKLEYAKLISSKLIFFFTAIGLPLLFSGFAWWLVILGFITMLCTGGFIMAIVFQMAHVVEATEQPLPTSEGNMENEWAIHQLMTTSNFSRNSSVLNWFLGGLNFQIEHHLFPNICHIHYRKISYIVERTALEFGLPYNMIPSFAGAIASHTRMLKMLGRKK
ncbi:MAG: acyl-CoA desaturase [Bacteroidetes bacterium]|nr:acyl-CoA desaturase [Bacteroidota bacterium]